MKLVLEKPWDWNDHALMYFDCQRPEMFSFPFWWYHIEGREVRLIKQISKTCGICFAENRWVEKPASFADQLQEKIATYEIDAETASELERRSWMTLGEVQDLEPTPREVVISHENGGGCIYRFHPVHGRMVSCIWINADGETIYKSIFEYNDKHYAVKYGNTLRDRWAKVWDKEKNKYIWKKW